MRGTGDEGWVDDSGHGQKGRSRAVQGLILSGFGAGKAVTETKAGKKQNEVGVGARGLPGRGALRSCEEGDGSTRSTPHHSLPGSPP